MPLLILRREVQTRFDGVIGIDHCVVHILQDVGQLRCFYFVEFDVVRIVLDVQNGGGDAGVILYLDQAQILQQEQSSGFIGRVVGNGDGGRLRDSASLRCGLAFYLCIGERPGYKRTQSRAHDAHGSAHAHVHVHIHHSGCIRLSHDGILFSLLTYWFDRLYYVTYFLLSQ